MIQSFVAVFGKNPFLFVAHNLRWAQVIIHKQMANHKLYINHWILSDGLVLINNTHRSSGFLELKGGIILHTIVPQRCPLSKHLWPKPQFFTGVSSKFHKGTQHRFFHTAKRQNVLKENLQAQNRMKQADQDRSERSSEVGVYIFLRLQPSKDSSEIIWFLRSSS